jgi:hypothetical protein
MLLLDRIIITTFVKAIILSAYLHSSGITIINRRGHLRSAAVEKLSLAGFCHAIQAKSGLK